MSSSRQTPTSKRSPSILVTDVRSQPGGHSAPFVNRRRLEDVSMDRLLSHTSEVPSARNRSEPVRTRRTPAPNRNSEAAAHIPKVPKVPRLVSQALPSRTSKQSQRLVLIPQEDINAAQKDLESTLPEEHDFPRVTSYLVAEGFNLKKVAEYLKKFHRTRIRLYDEALFADYLLPLLPGDGNDYRARSSLGDNRSMERMITMSEQRDHHFEYFSGQEQGGNSTNGPGTNDEFDPSEPQDFSPRPDHPLGHGEQRREPTLVEPPASSPDEHSQSKADDREARIRTYMSHAEMFVFSYGAVVFWNFTEGQEKSILADLCIGGHELAIKPMGDQEIETEELLFHYASGDSQRPRIFNDVITLSNNNHMLKLALSYAAAQSTKLCIFEERMQTNMQNVKSVPKTLALTGKLGLNREQLLRISGRLFKLRVDVNLSSNVLDTPDFFWTSEPSLHPLYDALRQYLEIDQRILVVNERCGVFLELTSILADSIAEFNMDRITVIVIGLIVLSICVSLTEIVLRFFLLRHEAAEPLSVL